MEAWAEAYIAATTWEEKLSPPPPPARWRDAGEPVRIPGPGRGPGFEISPNGEKSTGKSALNSPKVRARLMHTFLHHELQAAELMGWALLAFPAAPHAFRRGLLGIMNDEIRHMNVYAGYLERAGYAPGAFPVRDWFWERVPDVSSEAGFCATMGMGFEAANLDHASRFATRFRSAGDEDAARIEELVHREEIAHVLFATRWFDQLTEGATPRFEVWRSHLPQPLSPVVMRGRPIDRDARSMAGADAAFLDALGDYAATP